MKTEIIVDQAAPKVNLFILDWQDGIVGKSLTADEAENAI